MAFLDRPRPASSLPTPPPGHLIQFIDENGTPSVIDSDRVVTPSATLTGDPLILDEQVGDPTTGAGEIAVYNKQGEGLQQRAPNNGPVTALGGGGSGTYLDGAQYVAFDVSFGNGVGPYEVNTGIIPDLVDNSIVHVRIESAMALENVDQDAGFQYIQFGWGVAPTLPTGALTTGQTGGGVNVIVSGQFNSVQLNASGEIVLAYSDNAPNEMLFIAKVAVYQKVLPWPPTFAA